MAVRWVTVLWIHSPRGSTYCIENLYFTEKMSVLEVLSSIKILNQDLDFSLGWVWMVLWHYSRTGMCWWTFLCSYYMSMKYEIKINNMTFHFYYLRGGECEIHCCFNLPHYNYALPCKIIIAVEIDRKIMCIYVLFIMQSNIVVVRILCYEEQLNWQVLPNYYSAVNSMWYNMLNVAGLGLIDDICMASGKFRTTLDKTGRETLSQPDSSPYHILDTLEGM